MTLTAALLRASRLSPYPRGMTGESKGFFPRRASARSVAVREAFSRPRWAESAL